MLVEHFHSGFVKEENRFAEVLLLPTASVLDCEYSTQSIFKAFNNKGQSSFKARYCKEDCNLISIDVLPDKVP